MRELWVENGWRIHQNSRIENQVNCYFLETLIDFQKISLLHFLCVQLHETIYCRPLRATRISAVLIPDNVDITLDREIFRCLLQNQQKKVSLITWYFLVPIIYLLQPNTV